MCKMKIVVNKLMLGNRELGYECWDGSGVLELTGKQIKDSIRKGEKVCGLTIDGDGELILDADGYFTRDIMLHSHIGNYKAMSSETGLTNHYLVCIGSRNSGGKRTFDCISSRFELIRVSEEEMGAYLKIGLVSSGARLVGDEIEVASTRPEVKEKRTKQEQAE